MKKRLVSIAICAAMLFSGCSSAGGSKDEGGEEGKVTLEVLSCDEAVDEEMMQAFMEENPNINIDLQFVPSSDYASKFSALASSGDIPDVLWTQAGYYADQVDEGLLMDLSEELEGDSYEGDRTWRESFEPALLENCESIIKQAHPDLETYDYAIPFSMVSVAVLYDKNMYEELGLSIPETWDDFMNNCEVVKGTDKIPLSVQSSTCVDWLPRLFWDQFCRQELDEEGKKFEDGSMTFNTESVQRGLTECKKLWDEGYITESMLSSDLETVQQMFIQGEIGHLMIAPDKLEYLMNNVPDSIDLGTFVLPGIAGLPSRSMGGSGIIFAASADTEHPEEAVTFLKYLTSKTNFETDEGLKYRNAGIKGVEKDDPELNELLAGYDEAAANGFCPELYVPVTVTTEIKTTFMTDLYPNYLMGNYDLEYICNELQTMYDEYKAS